MANQSGIDVLLNFIVNNKDALKGIISVDASMKNYNKTITDNSTTVKNNSKVVNDNSTTIINKTTVINRNTEAVKGNSMAFAGLGVAIAGAAASIKSLIQETSNVALEFETQMRNVNSIAKMSEEQFTKMSQSVRDVAKMEGVKDTATGISKAMYQLVSSGFEGAKALQMAGIASKAASAGLTSTETAVTALAAMMNAYNEKTVPDAIKFSNQLFTVVDKGVITFEQLATNLGTVLAQASSAGVSFNEVGAAFITLTKAGINASESETAISNLIRTITDPDDGAISAAKNAGIEFNAMALESKGLKGVLDDLYKATGGNTEAIAQFIPEARAQKAALTLLKNAGYEFVDALDSMGNANEGVGSTQRALNEQMKAASFEIAKMKALVEDLKIEFGNISKNALMPFMKDIKGIINFIMSLDTETKTAIVQIGIFAAGFASLMLAVKAFAFVFSPLVGLFSGAISWIVGLTAETSKLRLAFGILRAGFFWAIGFFGVGGPFAVAVAVAVGSVLALERIVNQVINAYDALKAMAGLKIRESALEKERENAKDLIKSYNEAKRSKEGLLKMSSEDLKAAGHAFAVRAAETTDPATKKRLREQGIAAVSLGRFKEQYEASKKLAAEQAEADVKAAARNKQLNAEIEAANKKANTSSKAAAKEKVKHEEDYRSQVSRIMEGMAEDEAKRTLDDLNYKVWAENKKYNEEKAILEKAIKAKQATNSQLKKLQKEHETAITLLYMDAQDEQNKTDKDSAEKAKEANDKRIKAEEEKAKRIEQITNQSIANKEAAERGYIDAIVNGVANLTGEFGRQAKATYDLYNSQAQLAEGYKSNIEAIKANTDLADEQKTALIGLEDQAAEMAQKKTLAGAILQAIEVGIKMISVWSDFNDKIKESTTKVNDLKNYMAQMASLIPGIGGLLAEMNKGIFKLFGGDEAIKTEDALNKLAAAAKTLNEETEKERQKTAAETAQKIADNDKKLQDQILAKREDIIQKSYETEQEAIKKTFRLKKEAAQETLKTYDKELEKAKSTIEQIDNELKKRTEKRQQSQETASAFQARRAAMSGTLPSDFNLTPIDKFEIEAASQEEQLKQSFAIGQISLDQLNNDLMDLAVRKNLFYERIANSLVVGTKENLDYQKKANDAYSEFSSLSEQTTEKQLLKDKELAQQQEKTYTNLRNQELKNIQEIENAQTNALIRLENKWKTPAGAFKLSMDEAMNLVADKMDAELSNFILRAKQAIYNFSGQIGKTPTGEETITRNRQLAEATTAATFTPQEKKTAEQQAAGAFGSAMTSAVNAFKSIGTAFDNLFGNQNAEYEKKMIAENERRAQEAAARFATGKGFATGGIFDSNKGFGVAMLHDNEMVLNPFQQKNLFDRLAGAGGGINVTINTGAVNSMADINKIASAVSQVIRTDYLRR